MDRPCDRIGGAAGHGRTRGGGGANFVHFASDGLENRHYVVVTVSINAAIDGTRRWRPAQCRKQASDAGARRKAGSKRAARAVRGGLARYTSDVADG